MPRRSSVASERRKVARLIGAIVLAGAPTAALAVACGTSSNPNAGPGADGAVGSDGGAIKGDGGGGGSADGGPDGAGEACIISVVTYDSGIYYDGAFGDAGDLDLGCIYTLPCGLPPMVALGQGCETCVPDTLADACYPLNCTVAEGQGCTDGSFTAQDGDTIGLQCLDCLAGSGRAPRDLVATPKGGARTKTGAYFAKMAFEEAASVIAFERLAAELASFGAPLELQRAALRAADEERGHADIMRAFARANGAESPPVHAKKARRRSLEAIAKENVVEGCVNETFGAAMLAWQATHAEDASVRAAFAKVAKEEEGHAALAFAVARWAESELDAAANARVARAKSRAIAKLQKTPKWLENGRFERHVGWPTRETHARLAATA
ncbi:MAG TPA: ferritin-like domain-containing protein, partial [Polyangiaceae bacterium]